MGKLLTIVLGAALAVGFYMVLIDTVSLPELYAMVGVALLAVLAFVASLEQGFAEAKIRARWLGRGWRALVRVPEQIVQVSGVALAQLVRPQRVRGQLRAVPFAGGNRPEDVGRRALSEILGSLAPNTIVIGVDLERELLLVHQLHRTGGPDEIDVLGLGDQ